MRRLAAIALAALLLSPSVVILGGTSTAYATDTEADAIEAVYLQWIEDDDFPTALTALDALYADTSATCQSYISLLFISFALIGAGLEHSPDNLLGTELGFQLLLTNIEATEYACRIAI